MTGAHTHLLRSLLLFLHLKQQPVSDRLETGGRASSRGGDQERIVRRGVVVAVALVKVCDRVCVCVQQGVKGKVGLGRGRGGTTYNSTFQSFPQQRPSSA